MSKIEVKVVVGANWGDEGKGLATHYFARNALKNNKKCLNVLYNGGSQRGHTVDFHNNRVVFHHLGSGTLDNAQTYFDQDFIINPMTFIKEWDKLKSISSMSLLPPIINSNCRVTTPYDMFINQIVETERSKTDSKHGSCGQGIWETVKRYADSKYRLTWKEMIDLDDSELTLYLSNIAYEYIPNKLQEYGIVSISEQYKKLIESYKLAKHYVNDLRCMSQLCSVNEFENLVEDYNSIVFEGGQGLALDENNKSEYPHVTASSTGSCVPIMRIDKLPEEITKKCNIEVCYVTRSYFTRHGEGSFPSECSKEEINPDIVDLTNKPNEWQGSIRYGKFDKKSFMTRCLFDICDSNNERYIIGSDNFVSIKRSCMITHLNYTNGEISNFNPELAIPYFTCMYLSDSKYAEDIVKIEKRS